MALGLLSPIVTDLTSLNLVDMDWKRGQSSQTCRMS